MILYIVIHNDIIYSYSDGLRNLVECEAEVVSYYTQKKYYYLILLY
jgi:spore coat protein CotF